MDCVLKIFVGERVLCTKKKLILQKIQKFFMLQVIPSSNLSFPIKYTNITSIFYDEFLFYTRIHHVFYSVKLLLILKIVINLGHFHDLIKY